METKCNCTECACETLDECQNHEAPCTCCANGECNSN